MRKSYKNKLTVLLTGSLLALSAQVLAAPLNAELKPATIYTEQANKSVYGLLDFSDQSELENARRGLLAAPEALEIFAADGRLVWSQKAYDFLEKEAPATVNPSLWRNTQLNHICGLFEVADGIYQVRGYDMSNITFIAGETGWIVLDPLISVECAQAAMELVNRELGERPIKAVMYSHSHVDHFGGAAGIISEEDAASGRVTVIAPEHFEEYAISENVFAGVGMGRRASYQYGTLLQPGEQGSLAIGIGMGQSKGRTSFIQPNVSITTTGQSLTIDGVEMVFQLTPGTEAPAEMNMWLPQKKALWMAENCTGTLHNLYTLRGAQIRDGNAWAEYIMESLALYGNEAEVVFQSHNWPHWGKDTIKEYLVNTAAAYKFINDQTLMYINQGYTETEVANMLKLPAELEKVWYTRQYYGTVSHNAKAVYEKYMGWYDANPVHLAELNPSDYAKKLVEYIGDTNKVLEKAKVDYANGQYQWVAEVTNMLVYADPGNREARLLCADALEQLGYQAESGPWRNAYLSGAQELRHGTNTDPVTRTSGSPAKAAAAMSTELILNNLGIMFDTNNNQDACFKVNIVLPEEEYVLQVHNGILLHYKGRAEDADATWTTTSKGLIAMMNFRKDVLDQLIQQQGDTSCLERISNGLVDLTETKFFNIIEP